MQVVRSGERPTVERARPLPTLQRLVDRGAGATSVTVLVNKLLAGQRVPEHVHEIEEVLLVVAGRCQVRVGGETALAEAGDAVIVPPNTAHSFEHAGVDGTTVMAVLASPDVQIGGPARPPEADVPD